MYYNTLWLLMRPFLTARWRRSLGLLLLGPSVYMRLKSWTSRTKRPMSPLSTPTEVAEALFVEYDLQLQSLKVLQSLWAATGTYAKLPPRYIRPLIPQREVQALATL